MIKSAVGENLDAWIHRLFPFVFWARLDPNTLTVVGALVSTGAAVALAQGFLKLGAVIVLVGGFFDLVDGVVARHRGISSRFGAFLDSTLDRWVDAVLMVGLSVYFAGRGELGHVALAGIALSTTFLVSYSKARAETVISRLDVGMMERGERIGVLAIGCVTGFPVLALWIITLGSTLTAAQRIHAAHRAMSRLDANEETRT